MCSDELTTFVSFAERREYQHLLSGWNGLLCSSEQGWKDGVVGGDRKQAPP
jgi:hypothetical protein